MFLLFSSCPALQRNKQLNTARLELSVSQCTGNTYCYIDVFIVFQLSSTAEEQAAEYSETGTVGISVYLQYFKAGYGYILSPIVFIFVIGQRVC